MGGSNGRGNNETFGIIGGITDGIMGADNLVRGDNFGFDSDANFNDLVIDDNLEVGDEKMDFDSGEDRDSLGEGIDGNIDLDSDGNLGNFDDFNKEVENGDLENIEGFKRSSKGGGLAGFDKERVGNVAFSLSVLMLMCIGAWWEFIVKGLDFSFRSPVRSPQ